jgi:hypothetical protein
MLVFREGENNSSSSRHMNKNMETKNNKDTNNSRDTNNSWDTKIAAGTLTISRMPLGSDMPATPVTAETKWALVKAKMSFRHINNISNSRNASSTRDVCKQQRDIRNRLGHQ